MQKLENGLCEIQTELNTCREMLHEAQRNVEMLSNSDKRTRGERGRAKCKSVYSKSQKRRQKGKRLEFVKSFLSSQDISAFEFHDEDGHIVKVSCNDHHNAVKSQSEKSEIDDLIFIMDSHYVTDNAYHEFAQRYPSLPRTHKVIKRRHEINELFEVKTLNNKYEGVYTSLESHLPC